MKGVILAGGLGTRLSPLTLVTNKHLLPVFDKPMIHYPIEALVKAGIQDILLVTGGNSAGDFLKLLGNGSEFGHKHLNYTYQSGEGGIAEALGLAEHFGDGGGYLTQRAVLVCRGGLVGLNAEQGHVLSPSGVTKRCWAHDSPLGPRCNGYRLDLGRKY